MMGSLYNWSAAMDGCMPFGRTGWDREEGTCSDVREQQRCMEACHGMKNELSESLWVRTRGQSSMGDVVEGVCCR